MKKFLIIFSLVLLFGCTSRTYDAYKVCATYTFDELEQVQDELYVDGTGFTQMTFNDFAEDLASIPTETTDTELASATLSPTNTHVTLANLFITTPKGQQFTIVSNETQLLASSVTLDVQDLRSGHTTLSLLVVGYDIPNSLNLTLCFESLVDSE